MSDQRSPLLAQFEREIIAAERARVEVERWAALNRGCGRGPTECLSCRNEIDARRKRARILERVGRIRRHLVNAIEYGLDSARDYRALSTKQRSTVAPNHERWIGSRWDQE